MRWLMALGAVALLSSAPAHAQQNRVKKAKKLIAKAESGKPALYEKAWSALGDAKENPETRDDPEVWVLVAQTAYVWETQPDLESPVPDPWMTTWKAWDTAIGKGAADDFAEPVIEGLATMESTASAQATNAYEGGRLEEAWAELTRVNDAQTLLRQVGRVDPGRELAMVKLHLVVATELGKLDDAREIHERLDELGGRRAGTTLTLARAIEEGEGSEAAITFLKPFVESDPDDAATLEAYVGMLLDVDRASEVKALLDANADAVGKAPGITLVHAQSWAAVRDLEKAHEAYEQALKVDGRNQEVLRGFADLALARARDYGKQASEEKAWRKRKELRKQRDEAFMKGMTLLQTSRDLDPEHVETLKLLREVYEEVEYDDAEEVAALEQAIQDLEAGGGE